jgi:amino acid adenylation domain-containing protein
MRLGQGHGQETETALVSIIAHRGAGLVTAVLAVLRCGAAYVPIDPSFPEDRQKYILSHSKCKLLIVDDVTSIPSGTESEDLPPILQINGAGHVALPFHECEPSSDLESVSDARAKQWVDPKESGLAYVLYTSGSTGKPKGVMVYNRGVVNIVEWFANHINVRPEDRVLGLTTFCFDISVLELFMPLVRGAALVLASSKTQKDPQRIVQVLREHRVTIMQATPTTFEMMLTDGWKGDASIRFLVGGEAFRPSLQPLVANSESVHNVYGPTETTIWSSCYLVTEVVHNSVPIGAPISETQFYLVNEQLQLAKEGEEGELWIAGVGVAKGYLNAPELTADRFRENPFGDGRVYRTGDVVRQLSDGNYLFVRRLDDQVKINGYRCEC